MMKNRRKLPSKVAIHIVCGQLGQGKTVFSVFLLHNAYKKGKKILSNVHLNFPYKFMDMEMIYDKGKNDTKYFKDKVLFIDELHLLMESRRSSASVNVDFAQNILIQLGKLDCTFICTTQLLSQVDLRIRGFAKYIITCRKVAREGGLIASDLRILPFDILIDLEIATVYSERDIEIEYATFDPKPYFELYDTREIIQFDRAKFLKR